MGLEAVLRKDMDKVRPFPMSPHAPARTAEPFRVLLDYYGVLRAVLQIVLGCSELLRVARAHTHAHTLTHTAVLNCAGSFWDCLKQNVVNINDEC
jgi:hypothetical protein